MDSSNYTEETVCFCFNHTQQDIIDDILKNGYSTIREAILNTKKEGGCNCISTNPKGR